MISLRRYCCVVGGTLWPPGEPSAQQCVIFCLQSVLPSDPASLPPRVRQTWFMLAQQRTRVSKNPTADFLHIQSQTCLCAIKSYRLHGKMPVFGTFVGGSSDRADRGREAGLEPSSTRSHRKSGAQRARVEMQRAAEVDVSRQASVSV